MRAAVFHARGDVRIEQVARPEPGPGEVAVAVAFNGLCGSDLHEFQAGPLVIPTAPHPLTGAQLPVILGHEFAGRVSAIGPGVTGVEPGDAVCVEPLHRCGVCSSCRRGLAHLCQQRAFHGLQSNGGGLSEVTVVPDRLVHRLPADLPLAMGALVEPMAVAHHAVARALEGAGPDPTVVVFGGGPIGVGVWFALRARGVRRVSVVEPSAERRGHLAALGADPVLDPARVDVPALIQEETSGAGADVVIDAAGVAAVVSAGLASLGPRGHLLSVGVYGGEARMIPNPLVGHEIRWSGSMAYTAEDFAAVIDQMATGAYDPHGWVTTIPFDALVEDGFEPMAAGTVSKVLVEVGGEEAGR